MNELIFKYAQDASGKIVHVDSVPRGLKCGCICPCCKEPLEARQAEREHGFAHYSNKNKKDSNRRANLKICYRVIMYKLAEQIIQEEKKICVPHYYEIFKKNVLEFKNVAVDDRYDRSDKQPDVIATTADGRQYLIEFVFKGKVYHSKKINYNQLSCIEIDLADQSFESLRDFLLNSDENRKWLNNQFYFDKIESKYLENNKLVKVKSLYDCQACPINKKCCSIQSKSTCQPILIKNNGLYYKICKTEEYNNKIAQLEEERKKKEEIKSFLANPNNRTCFDCACNIDYRSKNDGLVHCGLSAYSKHPSPPPDKAKTCKGFKIKS